MYKMTTEDYNDLIEKEVHKNYRHAKKEELCKFTEEQKTIVNKLDLQEKVFASAKRPAFGTLKDTKDHFEEDPEIRLLNPWKLEIGKISQQFLSRIVNQLRAKLKFNHWKNSDEVIDWFVNLKDKKKKSFIVFDIKEYYPSITEELLSDAVEWAQTLVRITPEEKDIIFKAKRSVLYFQNVAWVKDEQKKKKKGGENFDVTMYFLDLAFTEMMHLEFLDSQQE